MPGFTAGELKRWAFVPEATYGTTPTAALTYGGAILNMTPKVNPNMEKHYLGDGQGYTQVTRGPYKAGFDLEYYAHVASGAYFWYNFAMLYALGATGAAADHLASFTASFRKYVGTTDYYDIYNGCKVNSLAIQYNTPGQPVIFKADVVSQFLTLSAAKAITGLQALTVGANPTDIATNLLCRTGVSQINLGGAGLANWYPTKLEILINRNLDAVPGTRIGADAADYPLEAIALDEGERDIVVTADVRYANSTYKAAKLAGTAITALTIPCGASTITLSNGDFHADDFPAEKQSIRDETLKMSFKSMTVA